MTVSAPALTGTTQAPSSPFPLLEIAIAVTAAVVLVAIALLVWIRRRAPQTVPGRPTGTQGLTGGDGPGATPPRSGP
jgi:hypothetical protein